MAILNDFDRNNIYHKPASHTKNSSSCTRLEHTPNYTILTIRKEYFSHFILLVIAIIKNATEDAAALQP